MHLVCPRCETTYTIDPLRFRCDCGGALEFDSPPVLAPAQIERPQQTLWRYRHALPLSEETPPVTLGEGMTPLVAAMWKDLPVLFKCESLNPTGSFKDRGTTVLATALVAAGVTRVAEDSSGNAGSSLAAYAARAGLQATIYVPAHASPVKQAQIAAYGAAVVPVAGPRIEATHAVLETVRQGTVYASHVYHPLISHGMKTAAFELCEQLGSADPVSAVSFRAPDAVVLPVGHGSLLLGLARGFREMMAAGCIRRMPRLIGVQSAACAPLAAAWEQGSDEPPEIAEGETIAEGVRISAPLRGRSVLAAVRESNGALLAIPDSKTAAAQRQLAHQGLYVEPTSALAAAALDVLLARRDSALLQGTVVVVLTGSGFKSPPDLSLDASRV